MSYRKQKLSDEAKILAMSGDNWGRIDILPPPKQNSPGVFEYNTGGFSSVIDGTTSVAFTTGGEVEAVPVSEPEEEVPPPAPPVDDKPPLNSHANTANNDRADAPGSVVEIPSRDESPPQPEPFSLIVNQTDTQFSQADSLSQEAVDAKPIGIGAPPRPKREKKERERTANDDAASGFLQSRYGFSFNTSSNFAIFNQQGAGNAQTFEYSGAQTSGQQEPPNVSQRKSPYGLFNSMPRVDVNQAQQGFAGEQRDFAQSEDMVAAVDAVGESLVHLADKVAKRLVSLSDRLRIIEDILDRSR
jgi:hypothetical protein